MELGLLSSRSLLVAFDMGLQGGKYSDHFRFCWWSETHSWVTHVYMSESMSPGTLNSTSSDLVSWVDLKKTEGTVLLLELTPRLRR